MTSAQGSTPPRTALAARKREVTRDAIVGGVVAAIRDSGVHFSVQEVADHAGVTARTVYRYFPSRQALLDAMDRWQDARFALDGRGEPSSLEDMPAAFERLYQAFDREPEVAAAAVLLSLTESEAIPARTERTERQRRLLEAELPHLPSHESAPAFAVIRLLASSTGWYMLASDVGLSGEDSGPAVRWALETLIADLRRRNAEAAGPRTRRRSTK
jgi:AcrR family transcriptional regulator